MTDEKPVSRDTCTMSGRIVNPVHVVMLREYSIPSTHVGLLEEALNKHGVEISHVSLGPCFLETAVVSSYMGEPVPSPEHLLYRAIKMYQHEVKVGSDVGC